MSIATEIARLQSDSTAIASAITSKGVTVPSGSGFDDYAGLIADISTSGGGGGNPLPYTPVEYIETDGVAYINSGVVAKATMSFDLKVKMNSSISSSEIFVGVGNTDGNTGTLNGLWHSSANQSKIGYGYNYLYSGILTPTAFTNPFEVSTRLLKGACVMGIKESGSSSYTSNSTNRSSTVSSSSALFIFATNSSGSAAYKASSGSRIYYIRIISGGSLPNLAFDGVPALYNGAYGLWDNVTNSFFGNNASSGAFSGPSI